MGILQALLFMYFITQIAKLIVKAVANGIKALQEKKKEYDKQDATAAERRMWQAYWDRAWDTQWIKNETHQKIDIRNIPRLSFSQWLTFYNSAPERWQICEDQLALGDTEFCAIPTYRKGSNTNIDTFWESPEELFKFIQWQKTEYAKGNAALFEAERAQQLSKLAKCLKEDISENNAAVNKELAALEEEVKSNMPKKEEFDPIRHLLDFSQQVKEGKVDRKMLYQKSAEEMLQSDGSLVTIIRYGVNDPALYKVEVQEIVTKIPGKKSPTTEWRIA